MLVSPLNINKISIVTFKFQLKIKTKKIMRKSNYCNICPAKSCLISYIFSAKTIEIIFLFYFIWVICNLQFVIQFCVTTWCSICHYISSSLIKKCQSLESWDLVARNLAVVFYHLIIDITKQFINIISRIMK